MRLAHDPWNPRIKSDTRNTAATTKADRPAPGYAGPALPPSRCRPFHTPCARTRGTDTAALHCRPLPPGYQIVSPVNEPAESMESTPRTRFPNSAHSPRHSHRHPPDNETPKHPHGMPRNFPTSNNKSEPREQVRKKDGKSSSWRTRKTKTESAEMQLRLQKRHEINGVAPIVKVAAERERPHMSKKRRNLRDAPASDG